MPTEDLFGYDMDFRTPPDHMEFHPGGGWDPDNVGVDDASFFTVVVTPNQDTIGDKDGAIGAFTEAFDPDRFEFAGDMPVMDTVF